LAAVRHTDHTRPYETTQQRSDHDHDRPIPVLFGDPPWPFATYSAKGKGRSQESFYDTMPIADIAALPVREMATDDSVLLLWVTKPILQQAFAVIEAWGFQYRTVAFTWVKLTRSSNGTEEDPSKMRFHFGLGFWTRANPEQCLLATRGNPKRINHDVAELIIGPVREHSRKPGEVYDRVERLVAGPYCELFARQHRPGWDVAFSPEADSGPGKRRWRSDSYPGAAR
jgi:N6-adenosine-specific RNA methylase IME4